MDLVWGLFLFVVMCAYAHMHSGFLLLFFNENKTGEGCCYLDVHFQPHFATPWMSGHFPLELSKSDPLEAILKCADGCHVIKALEYVPIIKPLPFTVQHRVVRSLLAMSGGCGNNTARPRLTNSQGFWVKPG